MERGALFISDAIQQNQRFYYLKYSRELLINVLKRRAISSSSKGLEIISQYKITKNDFHKWKNLFPNKRENVPFTLPVKSGSLALMRFINLYGFNFKNLLHVKSKLVMHQGMPAIRDASYRTVFKSRKMVSASHKRAIVVLDTETYDSSGALLMTLTGWFMIKKLTNFEVKSLSTLDDHAFSEFDGLSKRQLKMEGFKETGEKELHIPKQMGLRYGLLSGDLNPIHTTRLGARLIGKKKPFIQGFCTLNLISSKLLEEIPNDLKSIEVTYTNPIYEEEKIRFRFREGRLEIASQDETLLAFGQYQLMD
jgi:hypothetical protein